MHRTAVMGGMAPDAPQARRPLIGEAFLVLGLALLAYAVIAWRETAQDACVAQGTCFGPGTTYHLHPLRALLSGLLGITLILQSPSITISELRGRPIRIGGWRHPIDAIGLRFKQLPKWRQVAIFVLAFPIAFWIWVIYQARRALLGPPAP
jgi:hypothetical protein